MEALLELLQALTRNSETGAVTIAWDYINSEPGKAWSIWVYVLTAEEDCPTTNTHRGAAAEELSLEQVLTTLPSVVRISLEGESK